MLEWKIKEFHCLERAKGKVNLQEIYGKLRLNRIFLEILRDFYR